MVPELERMFGLTGTAFEVSTDATPTGVESLAAAIGEARETIEDVLEPYLIQQGFMMRTPRGRVATAQAYRHYGLKAPRPGGGDPVQDMFND